MQSRMAMLEQEGNVDQEGIVEQESNVGARWQCQYTKTIIGQDGNVTTGRQ